MSRLEINNNCICGNDHIEKVYGWDNLFAESGYKIECPYCKLKTRRCKTDVEAIMEWNEMQKRLREVREAGRSVNSD